MNESVMIFSGIIENVWRKDNVVRKTIAMLPAMLWCYATLTTAIVYSIRSTIVVANTTRSYIKALAN